jgi:hypothetical protein
MRVLIACEESQEVCKAFRERGHEAYSCDIQPCSGGHPEYHINYSCLQVMWGGCEFITQDGKHHEINDTWDLLIAHPPCTYLTVTGNSWFNTEKYVTKAKARYIDRVEAISFFMDFVMCNAKKIAIENPIGIMSNVYRKPNQIIHPYQFGHATRKSTCLWLENLPCLIPTDEVEPEIIEYKNGKGTDDAWHMETIGLPADERRKLRSKTFPGIAKAMAEQWG